MTDFIYEDAFEPDVNIKVVGVGGGGGNALNCMVASGVQDIEYIAINTEAKALNNSKATTRIQIGAKLTQGRGAGNKPAIGAQSAEENKEEIEYNIKDTQHNIQYARRFHITAALKHLSRYHSHLFNRYSKGKDQKILRSTFVYVIISAKPRRQSSAYRSRNNRKQQSEYCSDNIRLSQHITGFIFLFCTYEMCCLYRKADGCGYAQSAYKPCGSADKSDSGCSFFSETSHHCCIDILHYHRCYLSKYGRYAQLYHLFHKVPA